MLLFLFVSPTLSKTSGDLAAPFVPGIDGKLGHWEMAGSAVREDDLIMLVPPIQYMRGAIWANSELPNGEWGFEVDFQVYESHGGNLAIWVCDRFGADGDVGGGPSVFLGVLVFVSVHRDRRSDPPELVFRVVQHSTLRPVGPELGGAGKGLEVSEGVPIKVIVQFVSNRLIVRASQEGRESRVYAEPLEVDPNNLFIGVTAQNAATVGRWDLLGVTYLLELSREINQRTGIEFGEIPRSNYIPEQVTAYRNPALGFTSALLTEQTEGQGLFTEGAVHLRNVLDVVEELTIASEGVASFKELNEFVRQTLIPYTQKWHRRTLKIVDQVRETRDVLGAAWNYSQAVMSSLNQSVAYSSSKTSFKLLNLGVIFQDQAAQLARKIPTR
jgi:hypothetical protein